jgi:MerR family transcriptional regulator, copper efflux regulator
MAKQLQVGELAKAVGKTVRALHLYEEMGLLQPTARSQGGYRLYDEEAILRVKWIQRLQDMGFALGEIQTFLKSWEAAATAPQGMKEVRAVFEKKLAETREARERLDSLERDLRESLAYLESCTACAAGHGSCTACSQQGHETTRAPGLVAELARSPRTRANPTEGD